MFKTLDDRAFVKAGPSLWNELPVDIHRVASVETSFSGKNLAANVFSTDLLIVQIFVYFFYHRIYIIINNALEYL